MTLLDFDGRRELSDALETLPGVPRLLVRATCVAFCGKLWHQAAVVLAAMVKRHPQERAGEHGGHSVDSLAKCCLELEACVRPDSNSNAEASSSPKGFKSKSIIQKLFDQLNWAVTEAASAVSSLHDARKALIEPLLASEAAAASATARTSTTGGRGAADQSSQDDPAVAPRASVGEEGEDEGEGGEADDGPPPMTLDSPSESPPLNPAPPPNPTNPAPNQRAPGSRPQIDESQVVRKIVSMLDTAKTLLQLLEFISLRSPSSFLSPPCTLNLTRLMELVPFVLGHFCMGPDAKCLNQLLVASKALQHGNGGRAASRRGPEGGLGGLVGVLPQTISRANERVTVVYVDRPLHDKVSKADLLSPLASCLVALWQADEKGGGGEGGRGSLGGVVNNNDDMVKAKKEEGEEEEELSPVGEIELDLDREGKEEGEGEGEGDPWLEEWDRQPFIEMFAGVVDDRVMSDLDYLVGFLQWPNEEGGAADEGLPPLGAFVAMKEALVRVRGQAGPSPFPPSPLARHDTAGGPFSHPLDINKGSGGDPAAEASNALPSFSPGHKSSPFTPSPIAEVTRMSP